MAQMWIHISQYHIHNNEDTCFNANQLNFLVSDYCTHGDAYS